MVKFAARYGELNPGHDGQTSTSGSEAAGAAPGLVVFGLLAGVVVTRSAILIRSTSRSRWCKLGLLDIIVVL